MGIRRMLSTECLQRAGHRYERPNLLLGTGWGLVTGATCGDKPARSPLPNSPELWLPWSQAGLEGRRSGSPRLGPQKLLGLGGGD